MTRTLINDQVTSKFDLLLENCDIGHNFWTKRSKIFLLQILFIVKRPFMANWTEARTSKYTNFSAKYMNSRSQIHWNIHRASVGSASCETIAGVLVLVLQSCTFMRNIKAHSILVQSEFCCCFFCFVLFLLLCLFVFFVFSRIMWCLQVYWYQSPSPNLHLAFIRQNWEGVYYTQSYNKVKDY